jgi:hypothetical protein
MWEMNAISHIAFFQQTRDAFPLKNGRQLPRFSRRLRDSLP